MGYRHWRHSAGLPELVQSGCHASGRGRGGLEYLVSWSLISRGLAIGLSRRTLIHGLDRPNPLGFRKSFAILC